MNKKILWVSLVVGALIAAVAVYLASRTFYPLVQVKTSDNFTLTFVSRAYSAQKGCQEEVAREVKTLKEKCPKCEIKRQECPKLLHSDFVAALGGEAINRYSVHTGRQAIVIEGPGNSAAEACKVMADEIKKTQPVTRCVAPLAKG